MNADILLKHFDRISDAPDAIPRLRRFILDLAVRGKLVEQDTNDEPAAELLKRILTEKIQLNTGNNANSDKAIIERDDLSTYKLPQGWILSCLGAVAIKITDGTHKTPTYVDSGVPFISVKDFSIGKLSLANTRFITQHEHDTLYKRCDPKRGDILIGRIGTLGKAVLVDTDIIFSLFVSVGLIRFSHNYFSPVFFRLLLNSPFVEEEFNRIKIGGGTHTNKLNLGDLHSIAFPLPPLAEQHRIVAKVDELMALCDQLEAERNKREARRDRLVVSSLNRISTTTAEEAKDATRFHLNHLPRLTIRTGHIKQLRQTILNLAVRGRLVPQDPNDELASELLKRIETEKARLVKEGAQKKEAALPALDLKQAPFTLPVGWAWARFPELGKFGRGKSKHRPRNDSTLFAEGTHLLIQTGDVARSQGVIKTYTNKYNDIGLAQSMKWPSGSLCITIAANIADSGILCFDACFPDSVVGFVPATIFPNARYFEYFVRTAKANLLAFAPATAQKNINLEILNAVMIPLPPLAEQNRIVAKIDELMALCDQLESQLTTTEADSRRLLEAVLRDALDTRKMLS